MTSCVFSRVQNRKFGNRRNKRRTLRFSRVDKYATEVRGSLRFLARTLLPPLSANLEKLTYSFRRHITDETGSLGYFCARFDKPTKRQIDIAEHTSVHQVGLARTRDSTYRQIDRQIDIAELGFAWISAPPQRLPWAAIARPAAQDA